MMKYKYNKGDTVIVFKSPESFTGFVGVIIDRDELEAAYCVRDAVEPEKSRWIKEKNLQRFHFDKPKNILEKVKRFLND